MLPVNDYVENRDEAKADIAKVSWQIFGHRALYFVVLVEDKAFRILVVKLHVLQVEVFHQLMLWRHRLYQLTDSISVKVLLHYIASSKAASGTIIPIPEILGFQKQKLDDEKADLGLIPLERPQRHAEDQAVQWNDVELPDQVVAFVDALVYVASAARLAEFEN